MKNNSRNIIFVGGIHGVGKGTICRSISKTVNAQHITASKILKWNEVSTEENKKVKDLDDTQLRLTNGLNSLIKNELLYLLDGHFCLLNSKGYPERVSEETFEIINPIKIVVVVDEIEKISERLNNRDGIKYNIKVLKEMQSMEIEYAKYIAKKLNISLIEIRTEENEK